MSTTAEDPFALLEETAKRQAAEQALHDRVGKAMRTMVFNPGKPRKDADSAFWATLALRLCGGNKLVASWEIDTAATDGERLLANPDFFAGLTDQEVVGVIAHEVSHVAMAHHARLGAREMSKANVAMDLAVNPLLVDGGFVLPKCRLMPGEAPFQKIPRDDSFESIYAKLPDQKQGDGEGEGEGDDPGRCGGVRPAGDGSEAAQQESKAKWEVAVAQARQVAKQRGQMSAGLDRMIDSILQPTVDWKEALRNFITEKAKTDYKWTPPNRRFASQGLYLPARSGETVGEIVIAIDESGSMSDEDLAQVAGELNGMLAAYGGVKLHIAHHDTDVKYVETWTNEQGPLVLTRKAGGGTDHNCIPAWIEENDIEPTCVVALTDLDTRFPKEPDYPWIWASTVKGATAPWGQVLQIGA